MQTCKEPTSSAQSNVLTGEVEDIDQQLYSKICEKQALVSQLEDLSKEVTGLNSYGKVGSICGNCHRKGHRRTKCGFESCPGLFVCGSQVKHPEHAREKMHLQKKRQQIGKDILSLKEKKKCMLDFKSNSELTFFKVVKPKLLASSKCNKYKGNPNILFRDMRFL